MTRPRAAKLCCRCNRHQRWVLTWPEGHVCQTCICRAVKHRGACPGCDQQHLLVGRDPHGRPVCVDCAGITTCFTCEVCGREDQQWYRHTCVGCSLARRLKTILDDGTGQVSPALLPLFEAITSMSNPISGMTWLNKPAVRARLISLADGTLPLTHEAIDTMDGPQGREFLRELLVNVGLLPECDKYLAAFERWRTGRLASITDPTARQETTRYLTWRHLRNLTVRSHAGRLTAANTNLARDQTDGAVRFLEFLGDRNVTLANLEQADLDEWFANATNPTIAVDFLAFAMRTRRCRRLQLPQPRRRSSPGSSPDRLAQLAQRLLDDDNVALVDRVAGLLVVLFAQPVTRICQLTISNVSDIDGEMTIALGPDPMPVPPALRTLIASYSADRVNLTTTNTATGYLFPGCRPGEHITAMHLGNRLRQLGITRADRQGALTQLLSHVPAPVVAKAAGYSTGTTAARATQAGTDWNHYAALRHSSTA
jgi:hypothetical protein